MRSDMHTLDRAKARLAAIARVIGRDRPVLYLDYPLHENIGDLAINAGTERFFAEHGVQVWRRHSIFDFPRGPYGPLPDGAVIVLHGGGNFGDIWLDHQEFRERVVREFPQNRIVVMPQTVYFRSRSRAARALAILAKHPDLHVFVRDRMSAETLREGGLRNVAAAPDMAHALWRTLRQVPTETPRGPLHLLRDDIEAGAIPDAIARARVETSDWRDCVPRGHILMFRAMRKLHVLAGRGGGGAQLARLWYSVRDLLIADGVAHFSGHSEIVTNRLHGMLLAALLRLPVVVIDNSYGKLSSYIDAWLGDLPGLRFCHAPAEAAAAD